MNFRFDQVGMLDRIPGCVDRSGKVELLQYLFFYICVALLNIQFFERIEARLGSTNIHSDRV